MKADRISHRPHHHRISKIRGLREKTIQSIASLLGVQAVKRSFSLFVSLLLYRFLGAREFGQLALVESFLVLAMTLSDFGIEDSLTRHRSPQMRKWLAAGLSLRMVLSVGVFVLLWIFAPSFSRMMNVPELLWPLRVASTAVLSNIIGFRSVILLKRKVLFDRFFIPEMASQFIPSILSVMMVFSGFGIWSLVMLCTGSYWIRSLMLAFLKPRAFTFSWNTELSLKLLRRSGSGWSVTLIYLILSRGILIAGAQFWDLNQLGFFYLAFNWSNLLVTFGVQYMARVMFPAVTHVSFHRARMIRTFIEYLHRILKIAMPYNILLVILAPFWITLLAGQDWLPAQPYFLGIGAYALLRSIQSPPQTVLYALGHFRDIIFALGLELMILLASLTMKWGQSIDGLVLSLWISKLGGTALMIILAEQRLKVPPLNLYAVLSRESVLGVILAAAGWVTLVAFKLVTQNVLCLAVMPAAIAMIFYVGLSRKLTVGLHPDLTPIMQDLNALMGRSSRHQSY